jgi:hypothetical protein
MRRVGFAIAGLLLGSGVASAQYIPRPVVPIGPPSASDVAEIVQAMGLDPIGAPTRSGSFFVQRAADDFGRVLRVTVDARRSQIVAIEAVGAARAPYGRFAGYGPYRRYYPGYAALPNDNLAPPGSIIDSRAPHAVQPRPDGVTPQVTPARPAMKSAAAPVPRKRPAAAPQEAAGTVEPVPQGVPAQTPAAQTPAQTPAETPPVTPLE